MIVSAFAAGPTRVDLPSSLSQSYSSFIAACKRGDEERFKSFLRPGAVEMSLKPRTEHYEYGRDLNLPFLRDHFSDQSLGSSQLSASVYSIRTATTYISFVKTAAEGWKIFRYGDKPVE